MKKKWLAIGIILLFVTTSSLVMISYAPLCSAGTLNEPDEYYFEDVNVLIIGRCRTVCSDGTWPYGLFIGTLPYSGVDVTNNRFERIRVTIFNKTILNPWISLPGLTHIVVFMHNATGIFFYGVLTQFSLRLIPPIVFVSCYADKVWIY
jgi:hypothetical protein